MLENSNEYWSGKIGLLQLSDYGYSTDISKCKSEMLTGYESKDLCFGENNWLNKEQEGMWSIQKRPEGAPFYMLMDSSSISSSYYGGTYEVYPVMYLKSNVNVVDKRETEAGLKYLVVE